MNLERSIPKEGLAVEVENVDDKAVVRLRGDIDVFTVGAALEPLPSLYANEDIKGIALDFGGIEFFDSEGCHLIYNFFRDAEAAGKKPELINSTSYVYGVLRYSGLAQYFSIEEPKFD